MNQYLFLILFLSIFFFTTCKNEKIKKTIPKEKISQLDNKQNTSNYNIKNTTPVLVVFKKEQRLEFWINGQQFLSTKINIAANVAIGIFDIIHKPKGSLIVDFGNDYYRFKLNKNTTFTKIAIGDPQSFQVPKEKLLQIINNKQPPQQIYIFPSDARATNQFEPCFACPHWMAEMYSSLALHLKKFKHS